MTTIRRATLRDLIEIQKLSSELFHDNAQYDEDLIVDWPYLEAGEKYFTEMLTKDEAICLIVEVDNQIVGYIASSPKELTYRKSKYFELNDMSILPKYRSQGLGSQLINEVKRKAKERGFQRFFVASYFHNTKAIAFYKKNGFSEAEAGLEMDL